MDTDLLSLITQALPLTSTIVKDAIALLWLIPAGPRIALLLWLLWIFYLAVMNLKRARNAGTLSRAALVLGAPALLVGYVLDVLANVVVFTVLLLEPPRWGEWTVSARLERHHAGTSWRARIAQWFESDLLGPYDPAGYHVGKP
ncbi:hypothetical protein [Hydrogenophaga sp. T2]|uniref:hypothetical protein n=1 Tax=Hydrogenophaga sp. T2 TaxID=3132823 RepID=UPI003CEB1FDA